MMPIGAEVKIRKDLKLGVLYKNRNNKRAMHACRGMLLLAGKKAFITKTQRTNTLNPDRISEGNHFTFSFLNEGLC